MRILEWIERLAGIADCQHNQVAIARNINGKLRIVGQRVIVTNHVRTQLVQHHGETVRDRISTAKMLHSTRDQIKGSGDSGVRDGKFTVHGRLASDHNDEKFVEKSNQVSLSWCESLKSRLNFVNRRSDMKSILKLVTVGLFILAPAFGVNAADRIGKIKIASGDVSITRDGVQIAAESGSDLFEADVVTTGTNSAVGMTFSDNSRVSLGPDPSMALEKFAHQKGSKDGFDLRIRHGSLTAASGEIAKTRPLAMRVLMPTTVLGVKGTEFAVRVGKSG